jgi:hypothetical protein
MGRNGQNEKLVKRALVMYSLRKDNGISDIISELLLLIKTPPLLINSLSAFAEAGGTRVPSSSQSSNPPKFTGGFFVAFTS